MSSEARAYRRAQRARYPWNWKQISRSVIARAGYRCEACGAEQGKPNPISGSKVWPCPAFTDSVARLKQPHETLPPSALV